MEFARLQEETFIFSKYFFVTFFYYAMDKLSALLVIMPNMQPEGKA